MKKFTLIELLVVIAIIGILASILLPSISKARDKGKWAVCLNNIRQIGLGLELYTIGNNNYFPQYDGWTSTVNNGVTNNALENYIDVEVSMICPSDKGDSIGNSQLKYHELKGTSYQAAAQVNRSGVGYIFDNDEPRKKDYYDHPTIKNILGDLWHNNREWRDPRMQWHGGTNNRRCNILFLDGHAKLYSFPLFYDTISDAADLDPTRGYH